MEAFGRFMSIAATVLMFFPLVVLPRVAMESERYNVSVENKVNAILEQIKQKGEITASDLLLLKEAAADLKGSLSISIGNKREVLIPENNKVFRYREELYTDDIEELINLEGRIILQAKDTISLVIEGSGSYSGYRLFRSGPATRRIVAGGAV